MRVIGEFALFECELSGSSRYPSSSYRGVRVIRVRVIGEFALSEFELAGSSRYSSSSYRGVRVIRVLVIGVLLLQYYYFLILKLKVALRLDNK